MGESESPAFLTPSPGPQAACQCWQECPGNCRSPCSTACVLTCVHHSKKLLILIYISSSYLSSRPFPLSLAYMVNYQNALYLSTFSEHSFHHLTLTEICLSLEDIAALNPAQVLTVVSWYMEAAPVTDVNCGVPAWGSRCVISVVPD